MRPPYITAWSGEEGLVVRPCPFAGNNPAVFAARGIAGTGVPQWGRLSEQRQRECAVLRLCQICGTRLRLPTTSGYSLVPPVKHAATGENWTTHEPLCCASCLPQALTHCPAIKRLLASGGLVPIAVTGYDLALEWSPVNGVMAVGFVPLVLILGRQLTVPEVLARAGLEETT